MPDIEALTRSPVLPPGVTEDDKRELAALIGRWAFAQMAAAAALPGRHSPSETKAILDAHEAAEDAVWKATCAIEDRVGPGMGPYVARQVLIDVANWCAGMLGRPPGSVFGEPVERMRAENEA